MIDLMILKFTLEPGPACDGSDIDPSAECCTDEKPCGSFQGDCGGSDFLCTDDHTCGNDNCDRTSSNADFGLNQKFDCCIPKAGIFI